MTVNKQKSRTLKATLGIITIEFPKSFIQIVHSPINYEGYSNEKL